MGFIPTLAAAGYLLCILSAVGRAGINPAPTECSNAAYIQVGVGFIPTLAAAGHLLCILSAVGRTGINPTLAAAGHLL